LFAAFVATANEPAPKPKVVPELPLEEPPKPTEEPIQPIVEPIIPIEEPINTKKVEQDILTLINELPNSNPINLNKSNKTQTEPISKTIEAQEAPKVEVASTEIDETDKSLMVMMSFTDWLNYFKTKRERELSEEKDKKALKTSWQKEKLTAAVEEDVDEIPEPIFKQAMDSIAMESSMMSESLAKILASQGKIDKAIDMYKKLSLRNPEKRSYFADLIEHLNSKRD
jgi:tetratricopeptide (TPR) repeat protein